MCKERYINPFTDFGFKKLFGTPANKKFLISFLNSLFSDSDKIVDLQYINVEKLGIFPADRNAVFDLYCATESGAHVIVEMQNAYQRYFLERSIYYSSFPIQEEANKGDWDFRLPKVYTVAFLNFRMPDFVDDPAYKHTVQLCDLGTGRVFYDKLTYIYLEMPKFVKELGELDDMNDYWLYVIKNINELDEMPIELKQQVFIDFFREAEILAYSKEERWAYEVSLKHFRDNNNVLKTAIEDATAAGYEKGKRETSIELARKLLKQGMDAGAISAMLGIDKDDFA